MHAFSIVIPSWQNLEYLSLACDAVRRHSAVRHEVIVFFNERDAACDEWAAKQDVRVLGDTGNVGVCAAVNRAAACATQDVICFLNDDMVALPGWDVALQPFLDGADPVWLSGTAIEAGRATACYIGGCDYGRTPDDFDERRLLTDLPRLKRPYNVVSTWTPIVMKRRDWQAVGGFDEAYFPGNGSDPDLAMKMYRHGCRRFIGVGTCLVYHFSRRTISRFDDVRTVDSRALFRRKWGMTRRRFLRRVLCRDAVLTPRLLARMDGR